MLRAINRLHESYWLMNDCTFIIFGASGDLSKRKLLPALYRLVAHKKLEKFAIIGVAWDSIQADAMLSAARPFMQDVSEDAYAYLKERCSYVKLDFSKMDEYKKLLDHVVDQEKKWHLGGNRMFYCAAASQFFCAITESIAATNLAKKMEKGDKVWHRIVYEKPFGLDANSAHQVNECIARLFSEAQIFRIDHYLTKELVGNIALVRFTNCVFEPLWNNRYIDNVQIVLSEQICVEGRGIYYDQYGALRDMVQNHMLELMALIGMESPERLSGDYIRTERAKVLEKIRVVDALLGQYEGYRSEKDVAPDSITETFAAVYLMIDNPRWAGVPFYLKTGKCLDKKETVIHIKFKQVDCLLAKQCPSEPNYLTLRVTPDAAFVLSLNVKKPGVTDEVTPVKMEFCHSCLYGAITPEAYEVILEEVMRGEQSVSVRFDEIESAWRVVDALRAMKLPVFEYKKGSAGPAELAIFSKKHGMGWRS